MKIFFEPSGGIIAGALSGACRRIGEFFGSGFISGIFTSYEKADRLFENSALPALAKRGSGFFRWIRRTASRRFETSYLIGRLFDGVFGLLSLALKQYGAFFMTFGAYTTLIYFIKTAALSLDSTSLSDLICGVIMMLISVPLLSGGNRTLSFALGESVITHTVLSEAFGVPDEKYDQKKQNRDYSLSVSVIIGIILGMITYFVHPLIMLASAAAVVFLMLILTYPEGGIVILTAIVPFIGLFRSPSITLAVLTLIVALSFGVKLLRGKRVLRFGISDLSVLLLWMVMLLSGFGGGSELSVETACLMAALMLVYFLAVNLIRDSRWMHACVIALVVSAFVVSFIGVSQYILGLAPYDWIDEGLFPYITGRATSLFDNPVVLATYIILAFPAALSFMGSEHGPRVRFAGFLISLTMLLCVVFTWSRGAWIGLAAGSLFYLINRDPRCLMLVPPAAGCVALGCFAFPDTFGARIRNFASFSDSANHYRTEIWHGVCRMLKDVWYCGTGAGETAFRSVYLNYASTGIENSPHAHSLYLQLTVQTGIIGLLLLIAVVFFALQKCFSGRGEGDRPSLFLTAGAVALLTSGIFDYTWYNFRVFFLFWCILGLASADSNIFFNERSAYESDVSVGETAADVVVPF